LDDERTDTNGLSEVDLYLSNCMDCIELVSTFYPETMVPMLYAKLQQLTKVYDEVKTPTIKPTSPIGPTSPSLMQNFDSKKIPLDVQFYLRLFARMSSIFVERFDSTAQQATLFMNEVFKIISIGNPVMISAALSTCVNMVPWMVKCSALESIRREFENLISAIMSIIVHRALSANFSHGVVLNQVVVNASILLISVTLTIKPQFVVKTDSFQYLYQNLPNWTTVEFSQLKCDGYSGMTVLQNLYTSIANVILTRGVDTDLKEKNQLEEWQQGMFRNFAQNLLMTRFRSTLVSLQTSPQAKLELAMLLYILSSIVNRADDLQKSARLIVMQNFQLAIENVIPLVRAFINDTVVLEPLLHFMLSLIRSLKVQIGLEFIEKCVMLFLELFSVDTMQQLVKNNAHGVMVQFLQLLISIVQDGSGRFTPLTDRIVDICRNIIFPHLRPDDKFGVEVLPVYYQLLYSIVNFNLKYFFDINVNVSRDPIHAKPQSEQAIRDFSFIFECYLKSFQSLDITIFRENINYLKELDNNRKIFGREVFVKSMLGAFLNCFLVVLVNKSHTLLREDIISVMYAMNRSSNWVVFEQFLSNFLMQQANLSNDQKGQLIRDSFQTIDYKANLQAFERCIQQFVNDLNFLTKH
jgi:enamine deaminase RidA (YjgF/YER057c/UK114 family)